jgi:hypothetical protein
MLEEKILSEGFILIQVISYVFRVLLLSSSSGQESKK